MAVLIEFPQQEDRLRAIDVLAEEGVGYDRVPKGCFLLSNAGIRALNEKQIPYTVIRSTGEVPRGPNP